MKEAMSIRFGDNVRIIETPLTIKPGFAGLIGNVYGETTPSDTNVEVIGELKEDFAFNVYFIDREESYWFAPDLLEFVDHAPGTEITFEGVDKKWVRTDIGEWEEKSIKRFIIGYIWVYFQNNKVKSSTCRLCGTVYSRRILH